MTQEEKAKAYDEAIERAKKELASCGNGRTKMLQRIFPELKEGEDERIRKGLLNVFTNRDKYLEDGSFGDLKCKDIISWLEKQGEQKPAWSEEDKKYLDAIEKLIMGSRHTGYNGVSRKDAVDWLKSLRPQSHWKPSDEQMKLLREVQQVLLGKDCHNRFVNFMYELKRLREE